MLSKIHWLRVVDYVFLYSHLLVTSAMEKEYASSTNSIGQCECSVPLWYNILGKTSQKTTPFLNWTLSKLPLTRVAEVVRRHKRPLPKSLDSDESFKLQNTLFCRDIKICCDLRTFWKTLGRKSAFWVKRVFFWVRSALLHSIYSILYWIKFANLQLRAKTTHLSRK